MNFQALGTIGAPIDSLTVVVWAKTDIRDIAEALL